MPEAEAQAKVRRQLLAAEERRIVNLARAVAGGEQDGEGKLESLQKLREAFAQHDAIEAAIKADGEIRSCFILNSTS